MNKINLLNGGTVTLPYVDRATLRRIVKRGYKFLKERSANNLVDRLFPVPGVYDFDIQRDNRCALTRGAGVEPSDLLDYGWYAPEHPDFLEEIGNPEDVQEWLATHGFYHFEGEGSGMYYVGLQDQWLREMVNDPDMNFIKDEAIRTLNNMLEVNGIVV